MRSMHLLHTTTACLGALAAKSLSLLEENRFTEIGTKKTDAPATGDVLAQLTDVLDVDRGSGDIDMMNMIGSDDALDHRDHAGAGLLDHDLVGTGKLTIDGGTLFAINDDIGLDCIYANVGDAGRRHQLN